MNVYLNAGTDIRNCSKSFVYNNRSVILNSQYDIDQSEAFIITAIPDLGSYNTTFAFEYWTQGVEYETFEQIYLQFF